MLQMNCVTPRVTCTVQLPRRKRVPYNSPRYDIGDSIATTLDEPDRGNAHPFPRVLATVVCVCVYRKNGSIAAMLNNNVPLTSLSPCFQGGHGPKRAVSKLIMRKTSCHYAHNCSCCPARASEKCANTAAGMFVLCLCNGSFFCVLHFRGHPPGMYGEKLGNELSSSVGEKPIFCSKKKI